MRVFCKVVKPTLIEFEITLFQPKLNVLLFLELFRYFLGNQHRKRSSFGSKIKCYVKSSLIDRKNWTQNSKGTIKFWGNICEQMANSVLKKKEADS